MWVKSSTVHKTDIFTLASINQISNINFEQDRPKNNNNGTNLFSCSKKGGTFSAIYLNLSSKRNAITNSRTESMSKDCTEPQ